MFKRFTIGTKILISLTTITALMLGSNYYIFNIEQQNIAQNFKSDLVLINNSQRQILENDLESIKKRTIDFSSDGYIRDMTKDIITTNDKKTVETLNTHLVKNKLSLDPSLFGINILSNKGVIIASTDQNEVGKDESSNEYFSETGDLTYGNVYVSDIMVAHHFTEGVISVIIAAPLMDKATGMRIGTLMNFVKAGDITASLEAHKELFLGVSKSYESTHAYVVTKTGIVVDQKTISNGVLDKKINPAIKCAEVTTYANDSGTSVIGLGSCLDNRWTLITEINEQESVAPMVVIRRQLLSIVTLLIAVILLFSYMLNRQVVRPIRALFAAVKKVGEGRLDVRTHIQSPDEIGDLSKGFDEMAGKLQGSHTLLAQKVREVTQDFEKFKLAVEGASDHVVITDADGKIIYANKAAEETTGYSQKEMLGNRPSLWGKQMPQEFYQHMWRTIKEEQKTFTGEATNKRKNGGLYIAEIRISPLFDEKRSLYGFVAIERDITKQKEVDKTKTEFVSIASHQLRTPLTIINWYVEMLASSGDQPLSKKQLQYLDEITRASKRMIELINSLLNVSRIELGTFMVEPEPVDFVNAFEDALKDISLQIARKKISVIKRFDKNMPLINADPKLLRMVFQNLLTNAVKYTQEDGVVTVGIEQRLGDILITIADTGIGIPAQQQLKIFQKFFRADNARIKEPDGNGLGLYIIKSIVENAGGNIWFSSEENKGTAFYVSLPLIGMEKKEGTRALAI